MRVLDFRDGALQIALEEVAAGVKAAGFWPGRARLTGKKFPKLASVIPAGERVTLVVDGEKLRIGWWSTDCHWETGPEAIAIVVPLESPSLLALLQLSVRCSKDAVRAGWTLHSRRKRASGTLAGH